MATDEKIIRAIFAAIDDVNEHLPKQHKIDKSVQSVLIDESKHLDSLAVVSLMVAIEQNIEDQCGVVINLTDGDAVSQTDNPFKSVEKLADHISMLVGAKKQ